MTNTNNLSNNIKIKESKSMTNEQALEIKEGKK